MRTFVDGVGTIALLELRQRVRSTAWYVLLAVFFVLVLLVTLLLGGIVTLFGSSSDGTGGGSLYSVVVFFVLLLGTLVTPALAGGSVNGDRDAGTLATTQVTLITTGQLLVGKFLAAWTAALAFLAVSVPFLGVAVLGGGVRAGTALTSVGVVALELGVVAAVGVAFSALLARPVFSVVATYLVVAALSIGTLIAFALGGAVVQREVTSTYEYSTGIAGGPAAGETGTPDSCESSTSTYDSPRFDLVWGVLAANPYVIVADAAPRDFDPSGNPTDLFGLIASGVRYAQLPVLAEQVSSECDPDRNTGFTGTAEEVFDETVPSWFVGLGSHVVLSALLLLGGAAALRTPARRLARGSRIA